MNQDFNTYYMCGAVYCHNDIIVFHVLSNPYDQFYLRVIIQIDKKNMYRYTFKWDSIPKDVLLIYENVLKTSYIEYNENNVLIYGTNILKKNNEKFLLLNLDADSFHNTKFDVANNENNELDRNAEKIFSYVVRYMNDIKKGDF